MLVLGIESSCDETAAAVVRDGVDVLSSVVHSQEELHCRFGGVVPELASRAHVEKIDGVIAEAMRRAKINASDLDAIAVTHQPGLVGSLLVGMTAAKLLALSWQLPIVGVNHIYAHLYAAYMSNPDIDYPAVGLVVSGGHTALYRCDTLREYEVLGATIDDAAGETFDKVAALLQLGYPGGPRIEALAKQGDDSAIAFPRSFVQDKESLQFSFSGLKTAVLYEAMGRVGPRDDAILQTLSQQRRADLAACFQCALVEVLVLKLFRAAKRIKAKSVLLGGGVACNGLLRDLVQRESEAAGMAVAIPPPALCTDNAVMVAGLGGALFAAGHQDDPAILDAIPKMS